jgi:hypothetical protein
VPLPCHLASQQPTPLHHSHDGRPTSTRIAGIYSSTTGTGGLRSDRLTPQTARFSKSVYHSVSSMQERSYVAQHSQSSQHTSPWAAVRLVVCWYFLYRVVTRLFRLRLSLVTLMDFSRAWLVYARKLSCFGQHAACKDP